MVETPLLQQCNVWVLQNLAKWGHGLFWRPDFQALGRIGLEIRHHAYHRQPENTDPIAKLVSI